MVRPPAKVVFLALTVCLTLVALEGLFFVAGKVLQAKLAMWKAPAQPKVAKRLLSYGQYLKERDPALGWPFPSEHGKNLAVNGANPNPHFPNGPSLGSCVSLYGDSFTKGGDTSSVAKDWGNLLSASLGCYVANFGMGGYGTDQAYLRFAGNGGDPSAVVVLGLHTEDVLRNLTRIRDLLNYERWYALKPRFILNSKGTLDLVPLPNLNEQEYLRAVGLAGNLMVVENENFQPGGPAGVVELAFPFTIAVVRNLAHFYGFRSRLRRQPDWMEFLQPGNALRGLEITAGISGQFVKLANDRNKRPLVVILPHVADMTYAADNGRWPYQSLVDEYKRRAIPFLDFGPRLLAFSQEHKKPIKDFFGPTKHYSDEGNALVAGFVDAEVRRLLSSTRAQR